MNATVIGIIIGIVMLVFMTFIKKDSKNSHLGINLKRIYCPKCNEKQPIIRKPANQKEALYGGNTCKNCGTEMDKYGTELNK
jgi:RNase P subunit RPR2